jgi:hypothetical protein
LAAFFYRSLYIKIKFITFNKLYGIMCVEIVNKGGYLIMKRFKRILASFVTVLTLLAITPMAAHAEWKQSGDSWWYSQGSSYATGWTQINGQWYYFDSNGYMKTGWVYDSGNWYYFYGEGIMAHDTKIDGCYLNSSGAWTTSIPVATTTKTSSSNVSASNNQSQTVYITATGKKYHAIPKCGNTKSSRSATLDEAQRLGLSACSKCY